MTKLKNNDKTTSTITPTSFWIIAAVLLIWNLMGAYHNIDFFSMTVESLVAQGMTITLAEFFLNVPTINIIAFTLSSWGAFIGAVLMIFRKAWAIPVFIFSAIIAAISFVLEAIAGSYSVLGTSFLVMMMVVVAITSFQVWYSNRMKTKGILQ